MEATMASEAIKKQLSLNNLILALSALQLGWLLWYFYTGSGGPQELVAHLIPITIVLQILFMYREGYLYPWLPPRVNDVIIVVYLCIAAYAFWHFFWEFEE